MGSSDAGKMSGSGVSCVIWDIGSWGVRCTKPKTPGLSGAVRIEKLSGDVEIDDAI